MKQPICAAAVLILFCVPMIAQQPQRPFKEGPLDERIKVEQQRRGIHGKADAELLLRRTREFVDEMQRHGRLRTITAIGGSTWNSIGPTNGAGRVTALAPHPSTTGTVLVGTAGGGVWLSTTSGASWTPLTDGIPNLSVGAVAYAPSNPNIVYVGTGEGGQNIDGIPGIGLVTLTNNSGTWSVALPASVLATQFYRISVNPTNASDLVVGTNAGLFRSTNGGGSWTQPATLPHGSSGVTLGYGDVTDIVRDPTNASVIYATTWDRNSWCLQVGGCGDPYNYKSARVVKSTDDGQTWSEVMTGLPVSTTTTRVSRMGIAIAPSSTSTLYVATSVYDSVAFTRTPRIFRTTTGGTSGWTETGLSSSADPNVAQYFATYDQSWYDNTLVVSPTNANNVMAAGVQYVKSTDGGTTWSLALNTTGSNYAHVDVHDLKYDSNQATLYLGNDGGVWTTGDFGTTTTDRNTGLVTRQFYTLVNDPANQNRVFGGTQDNGSLRRPDAGGTAWDTTLGGDGFAVGLNFDAPSIVFNSVYGGAIYRTFNAGAAQPIMQAHQPLWQPSSDSPPFDTKIYSDPTNSKVFYTVSYRVWKTTDSGITWLPLPTTTTDASTWPPTYSNITAMAIAPSSPQTLMVAVGGMIFRSTNGGTSWINAATALSGFPAYTTINALAIDNNNPSIAYAGLAGLAPPNLYVTSTAGATWTASATGLPSFSVQVLRVDPTDSSTIYAGTDVGVYRSTNGGASWSMFGTGLPACGVWDINILHDGTIVRAATHGRGAWELAVTSPTNAIPTVGITAPGTTATVARGGALTFTGKFSESDGDPMTAYWIFPDDGSAQSAVSFASVTHTFSRAGRFPVTLNVKDSHGGIGTAAVDVTVTDPADLCASPVVIPGTGPFPYTVAADTAAAAMEVTDPASCGGAYNSSVWFSFTPSASNSYTFSLCGTDTSAVLDIYSGTCAAPVNVACVIDYGTNGNATDYDCSTRTRAIASLAAGTTYLIKISEYFYQDFGPVSMTVTPGSGATPALAAMFVGPATGSSNGGTSVTISGYNFDNTTTVAFGGVAASNVTLVTPNLLTASAPAHATGDVDVTVTKSTTTATLKAGFTYVTPVIAAPTGVLATATTANNVHVTWNAVTGATSYQIFRKDATTAGLYIAVGASATTAFDDGSVLSNTSYLYKVHSVAAGSTSLDSNTDYATTVMFTDDPLVAMSTVIKATHLAELRTAVNALRTLAGVGTMSFMNSGAAGTTVAATDLTELRNGLNGALTGLGRGTLTPTYPGTTGTVIHATDFQEIRNLLK